MNKDIDPSEVELIKDMASLSRDPLKWVIYSFPWGTGELKNYQGPDTWQKELLIAVRDGMISFNEAMRFAVASGNGPGKSAMSAWLILWALSTFEDTKGIITSNTESQLKIKSWAELAKWYNLFIAKHWFKFTATAIYSADASHEKTWRIDQVPWNEQRSEAFAGMHNKGKRILIIFDEACHDEKTEVLTDNGWEFFKDLTGEEKLLTMNPKTLVSEYASIKALHQYKHDGEMYVYKKRGFDFKITSNHKMFTRTWTGRNNGKKLEFRFEEIKDMPNNSKRYVYRHINWDVPDIDKFILPEYVSQRKVYEQKSVDFDLWAEFLGWYCSEGHLVKGKTKDRIVYHGVGISQKDKKVLKEIYNLCDKLGFEPKLYDYDDGAGQVILNKRQLSEFLSIYGLNCIEKRVPDCIRFASKRQINIFLNSYLIGDGYERGNRDIFYTSSKSLANDLQELILKGGGQSTLTQRKLTDKNSMIDGRVIKSSCEGYVISRTLSGTDGCFNKSEVVKENYKGNVYCAELNEHHLLFTRRNGVCMWSGNSGIPDSIWNVTEGALTDEKTEIFWFVFGNPTRNNGKFHGCFHGNRHRWQTKQIDIRTSRLTNKKEIEQWIEDYGEDSDFVRIHVKGEFPNVSDRQFIPHSYVQQARGVELHPSKYNFAARILAVDPAWMGGDETCIGLRQGNRFRILARYNKNDDDFVMAGYVAKFEDEEKADAVFVDFGYGTGIVSAGKQLGRSWKLIAFGGESGDTGYLNKRAEMWGMMKDWLRDGGTIPDDPILASELVGPEYYVKTTGSGAGKIVLESKTDMKRRGLASPNRADTLALTFAAPVANRGGVRRRSGGRVVALSEQGSDFSFGN